MLDMGAALGAVNAAIGNVEVTAERVRSIANDRLPSAEDDVHTHTRSFRDMPVTVADFGEVPVAQTLAEHHEAAYQVFSETVAGVLKDLEEFRAALIDCMDKHQETDEGVQTALLALGTKYRGHSYHATQNYRHERQEQGRHLGRPDTSGAAGRDGGAHHGDTGPGSTTAPPTPDRSSDAPAGGTPGRTL
jgi:hypothetical protein